MKDEGDSISNESNNESLKTINNKNQTLFASSSKLEPQSSSSLAYTDTDTPSTSNTKLNLSKTQKRQFETIKNELNAEESSDAIGLSSASSSNSLIEADQLDSDNRHLIESESKRQKSDLINSKLSPSVMDTDLNDSLLTNDSFKNDIIQTGENETKQSNLNSIFLPNTSIMTDDDDEMSTSKNSNESQFEFNSISTLSSTDQESEATTSKNTKLKTVKSPKVKFDPNECHDWDRIHDTTYFAERSLNFNDLINREFGFAGRFGHGNRNNFGFNSSTQKQSSVSQQQLQSPRHLMNKAINGFNFVRRMKMSQNLNYHEGCVNALNFNRIGTLLASGSDDYQVCIWDWARSKVLLTFDSGHKSNVFQTKFMPFTRDSQIVTCARDGQVRLALISSSGSHIGTKKLAKHSDSCHKLSIEYDSSNMFLSCGEDGVVYEIDLRQSTPAKILSVKNYNRNCKLPLYSISSNPFDTYQFIVAGKDPYVRVYDKRMLVDDRSKILKLYSPIHLRESQRANITSAVYNYNGTEIIASYSDDDIYLYETSQDSEKDAKFRYRGHRNSETIKGVNFYGANSDFIVSGSDCGRVFFWEKSTQQIVQALKGDESGVVNVIEPHPNFPILATSGLDSDIKIWSPTSETPNAIDNLADIIKDNQRLRDTSRHFSLSSFEFELLLLLMHRPNNRVLIRSNEEELIRSRITERENAAESAQSNVRHRRRLLNRIETETNHEEDDDEDDDDYEDNEDDDDDEEDDEEEDEDDFLNYDEEDNESSYNFHENDNDEEHYNESSDNSRLTSFFNRRRYSRDRNEDSHTSDYSSSNTNNNRNT